METVLTLFLDRCARDPQAIWSHLRVGERWESTRGAELERAVASASAVLAELGVGHGDRVAILGPPHPLWVQADVATLALGAITVGIYPTLTAEEIAWQLGQCGAKVLLVGDEADATRLRPLLPPCVTAVRTWDLPTRAVDLEAFRAKARAVRPDDVCTIIYTSGTTGNPKGVVLSHRAFVAVVRASQEAVELEPGDSSMIFLPLAHSLQRLTVYRGFAEDAAGWFVPRLEDFQAALPVVRPTILASVPRMLEKIKAKAEARVASQSPRVQAIFAWAMRIGEDRSRRIEKGEALPLALRLKYHVAQRLVFSKVHAMFGGRLRTFAVGGARLDPAVARFFHAMGIEVFEAWGLSETCAPATLNTKAAWRFGTVGRALPGVELKLDEDGEVLVRGPGLFDGYWDDPVATAAAFTADGFFRTGDIGELDADGFLRIVDRKKEILVTSGGKNIPPVNIEKRLEGGAIGQAVVIGDDRPYLVALFAPDPEVECVDPDGYARGRVAQVNAGLAPFEQVKAWAWIDRPLSPEDGTLTPTLKLKRRVIRERHAKQIAALYRG